MTDKKDVLIEGIPFSEYSLLNEFFTFDIPNAVFIRRNMHPSKAQHFTGKKNFIKNNMFRYGLLDYVLNVYMELFPESKYEVRDVSEILPCLKPDAKLNNFLLTGNRTYQQDAVDIMMEESGGIIKASTNSGKAVIMAAFLQKYRQKTLVLIHRAELHTQLWDTISQETDLDVGKISANVQLDGDVIVCMVQTLANRIQSKDPVIMKILAEVKCVIIDECLHSKATTYRKILNKCKGRDRTYGMSGTPFEEENIYEEESTDNLYRRLESLETFGKVIYEITNEQLQDLEINTPTTINIIEYESSQTDLSYCGEYAEVYEKGIVYSDARNKAIAKVAYLRGDLQGLIIVDRIMHGEELMYLIEREGVLDAVFLHGELPYAERTLELNKFKARTRRLIICSKIFDEGINLPTIDYIINAAGGKAPHVVLQRIGRGLRKDSLKLKLEFFDFKDIFHRYLEDHYIDRLITYSKEGCFDIEHTKLEHLQRRN